jgi:hypothetical protein
MPMGSNIAKMAIHAFLTQISRKMRLRVSSSSAIAGSALDASVCKYPKRSLLGNPQRVVHPLNQYDVLFCDEVGDFCVIYKICFVVG